MSGRGKKEKGGAPVSAEERLARLNRALPFSGEAEKGLLSCLLQDPEGRIPETRAALPAEAFYAEANRIVYEQLVRLSDGSKPIDPVFLTQALRDAKKLEIIGGPAAVSELFTFIPIPTFYANYKRIVRNRWLRRIGLEAHAEAIEDLFACEGEVEGEEAADILDVLMRGEQRVFAVVEAAGTGEDRGPVHSSEVVNEVIDHLMWIQQSKGKVAGVSTGWPDLDRAIGGQGLEAGDKMVIGARPKMGKTNVLCTMVKAIAVDQEVPSLVLSLEMRRDRLWRRILFGGFGIETSKANTGFLSREDMENLGAATVKLQKAPLEVDDRPQNTNTMRATIRAWARKHALPKSREKRVRGCVFLDYVQLVEACKKIGQSEERHQIAEVMKAIADLAKELDLVFVVLAQANRSAESNPRHEPGPKDFDGGSAIEKFLDYGAFIHRPAKYKRWQDLDDKAKEAFRKIVEPARRANPDCWSPLREVRDGMGKKVMDGGRVKLEWDIERDWNEHSYLILCLNRNGDDARIWLRFRAELTRFDARTTRLYSNNKDQRQVGYGDSFVAGEDEYRGPEPERSELEELFGGGEG